MADPVVPQFCNDVGSENIRVGVKKFNCAGASAPFDHPHVYLDMGAETQIICPYCSTLYVHDKDLGPAETDPAGCLWRDGEAA